MDTKFYLSQIGRLEKQIQNKMLEIDQLRTMACSTTVSNEGDRVQTSGDKDRLGAVVSKIVDMEREVDEMIDKRCDIVSQIDNMKDTDMYDVLANVYILQKALKVVAIEKRMSYRHIKRVYSDALKCFEEKYGESYLCN